MANQNFFNKNSQYVSSLVSFINDTKPYHSKLTEIAEEYQFYDSMNVRITESTSVKTRVNPVWSYNFFSSGDVTFNTMPIKALDAALSSGYTRAHGVADQVQEFASIPYVYSKKAFDGNGVTDVLVERANGTRHPMVEGLDWFQSHGGFQFQVKQTSDAQTNFVPSWAETRDDTLISTASANTRLLANDLSVPSSAASKLLAYLNTFLPADLPQLTTELNRLITEISAITHDQSMQLPRDYELLIELMKLSPSLGLAAATAASAEIEALTPSLYFNIHSDSSLRESGRAIYDEEDTLYIKISNISITAGTPPGDTWRIVASSSTAYEFQVFSSIDGYVGTFTGTGQFVSSTISFYATIHAQAPLDFTVEIHNRNRLVFGSSAPLETWDIIKTNPLAYSRPILSSTRYGFIRSLTGVVGEITILDGTLPSGTVILTARADGTTFDLSSSVESAYVGVCTTNVVFNDGRLGFTIVPGSAQGFVPGDVFYIQIVNEPAKAIDLDLGYGYDLDAYDDQGIPYSTNNLLPGFGTPLQFVFDTRYNDYDLHDLGLVIDQSAVSGRKFRMVSIPNVGDPLDTDPILDPLTSAAGVTLYYASTFLVERSDDNFNTVTSLGVATVGSPFSAPTEGISFTIVAGSKPFIGAISADGVQGGDTFSFTVLNEPPYVSESPIGLTSSTIARLAMHGDGFYDAKEAIWTVQFTSSTEYTVQGVLLEAPIGTVLTASGTLTTSGLISKEGRTFNDLGIQFTVLPGSVGLAAGDQFTFRTYKRKPSYLVHGSVSGWQPEAVIGETYWNGIIGFRIQKPVAKLFSPSTGLWIPGTNVWSTGGGTISLSRLRDDAETMQYTLTPNGAGYVVSRDDQGIIGFLPSTGTFSDTYITLETVGCATPALVTLQIIPDDFTLWNGHDAVLLRPEVSARLPGSSEYALIERRTNDSIGINLKYDALAMPPSLLALYPQNVNPTMIDTYTGFGTVPLLVTSPETALLEKFLPLTLRGFDSSTSIAEFPDAAISYELISSGDGSTIGTVSGSTLTFDPTFFGTYLPLNAEANVITYGSGFNELVHVRISESVKFLVDGGALTTSFMFEDTATVTIVEDQNWSILQSVQDAFNALIQDDPFGGFLAGYDNLPYDAELGAIGYYDQGAPLTDYFSEAQALSALSSPTQLQSARLIALTSALSSYLTDGTVPGTTLDEFLANLDAAPEVLGTTGFGIPARGLGIDISTSNGESTAASIQDAMVTLAVDRGQEYDAHGYDTAGYDAQSERFAIVYSGSLPPVPTPLTIPALYEDFDTPFAVVGDSGSPTDFAARVFEISFRITLANKATLQAMPNPKVFIWLPSEPAPIQAPVVQKMALGRYQLSLPSSSEAKLYIVPGL